MMTGYFGKVAGNRSHTTKIHIFTGRKKALCGYVVKDDKLTFHWTASGVNLEQLECKKCIKAYQALLSE